MLYGYHETLYFLIFFFWFWKIFSPPFSVCIPFTRRTSNEKLFTSFTWKIIIHTRTKSTHSSKTRIVLFSVYLQNLLQNIVLKFDIQFLLLINSSYFRFNRDDYNPLNFPLNEWKFILNRMTHCKHLWLRSCTTRKQTGEIQGYGTMD